jgi:predicted nucleic acid-binding protein
MIELLLDSVILIDHLNDIPPAVSFVTRLDVKKTAISVISYAEILTGVREDSLQKVKAFLQQYNFMNIDKEIAERAAELRRLNKWKLPDAFQAALAVHYGVKLYTRNTKDFDPEKHAFVEVPYTL